jgi:GntR family transcriptional regulator, galactonate operon transcriptional repressor
VGTRKIAPARARAKPKDLRHPHRASGIAVAARTSKVHGSVVKTIGSWILSGKYPPHALLPREDDLAGQLGVSRTSLREAVKVLSAKGLLEARRRIGVRVRGHDEWDLLDPSVLAWHPDIGHDETLMTSLIEARRIIEPAAAALAAARASAADLAEIEAAFLAMEQSVPNDIDACCEADLAFHASLIAASHNIVLRRLSGTIEAALRAAFAVTNQLMTVQSRALEAHRKVLECIRMRNVDGARAAAMQLLDIAARDLAADAAHGPAGKAKPKRAKR